MFKSLINLILSDEEYKKSKDTVLNAILITHIFIDILNRVNIKEFNEIAIRNGGSVTMIRFFF